MTLEFDWDDRGSGSSEIAGLSPWFHNLHLPDGRQTAPDHPLGDFPAWKWRQLADHVPADLTGAEALDIGCNAGFYSFELARRGASVLALDLDPHYLAQARWAAAQLDPHNRVRFAQGSVYDLAGSDRRFDLVLFLGVLYHLRHPLLALDLVAGLVRGRLVLQTMTMPGAGGIQPPPDLPLEARDRLSAPGWPQAAFIEGRLAADVTNWWVPNDACVRAMARSAGLRILADPGHELYVCEPDPGEQPLRELRERELQAVFGAGAAAGSSQRK